MDIDQLYGLPLEQFILQRTALAKALRAERRREEAREVAALKKPSVAAWAVNQVVRTQVRDVEALFAAGHALRAAQEGLLAGDGDVRALRTANDHLHGALSTLTAAAQGLVTADGHQFSAGVIERVGRPSTRRRSTRTPAPRCAPVASCESFGMWASGWEMTPTRRYASRPSGRRARPRSRSAANVNVRGLARLPAPLWSPPSDKSSGRPRGFSGHRPTVKTPRGVSRTPARARGRRFVGRAGARRGRRRQTLTHRRGGEPRGVRIAQRRPGRTEARDPARRLRTAPRS